jgi:hypothetical protein
MQSLARMSRSAAISRRPDGQKRRGRPSSGVVERFDASSYRCRLALLDRENATSRKRPRRRSVAGPTPRRQCEVGVANQNGNDFEWLAACLEHHEMHFERMLARERPRATRRRAPGQLGMRGSCGRSLAQRRAPRRG